MTPTPRLLLLWLLGIFPSLLEALWGEEKKQYAPRTPRKIGCPECHTFDFPVVDWHAHTLHCRYCRYEFRWWLHE